MSNIPNIGWLFYKKYYWQGSGNDRLELADLIKKDSETNEKTFEKRNANILKQRFVNAAVHFVKGKEHFSMTTTYPGLLIGTGYTHETGSKGEFKLGFYFDHTTGQPILPGSSVKGTLRSVFKRSADYIKWKLSEVGVTITEEGEALQTKVDDLMNEIFEGKNKDGNRLGIYQQDTFYDAYISASSSGKILDSDYITPHYTSNPPKPKDLLKNPIPLMFLKVRPNVTFTFNFDLKDGQLLTATQKKELFKLILQDIGIGAKTNVGYGQFK